MRIYNLIFLVILLIASCKPTKVITGGDGGTIGDGGKRKDLAGAKMIFDPELSEFMIEYDNSDKFETFDKVMKEKKKVEKAQVITPSKNINSELENKLTNIRYYNGTIPKIKGYRILVYTGSDLAVAKSKETKLKMTYGQEMGRIELKYVAPNYVLKYGTYYSRLKAYEVYTKLIEDFPSLIVVSEIIKFDRNNFLVDDE
ncbi:MAG: hypothetical protein ACI85I_002853 [Arenicella sp.]|jgi:hypothetical protein